MGLHRLSEDSMAVRDIADFALSLELIAAFAALLLLLTWLLGAWPVIFLALLALAFQFFRKKTTLVLHRHLHSMEIITSSFFAPKAEKFSLHHVKKIILIRHPFLAICSIRIVFSDGRELDPHITLQFREAKEAASFAMVPYEIEKFLFA